MRAHCRTAGLTVDVVAEDRRTALLLEESFAGQAVAGAALHADVHLTVEGDAEPFDVAGWEPLTRGSWCKKRQVVLEDACSSGYDLLVTSDRVLEVRARRRRAVRDQAIAQALPGRHHLLVRAALVQYPALWWAGVRGRVPLHASVLAVGPDVVVLAGPGGTGKSTLLRTALADGARATCDNLAVSDGGAIYGLLEPVRIEQGTGRRMPHGRREGPWVEREDCLMPTRGLVVRRGAGAEPVVASVSTEEMARVLTAGTYAAGELRRYWALAATLALGTGRGPAHPPVAEVAKTLAGKVHCSELVLPGHRGTRLSEVLSGLAAR